MGVNGGLVTMHKRIKPTFSYKLDHPSSLKCCLPVLCALHATPSTSDTCKEIKRTVLAQSIYGFETLKSRYHFVQYYIFFYTKPMYYGTIFNLNLILCYEHLCLQKISVQYITDVAILREGWFEIIQCIAQFTWPIGFTILIHLYMQLHTTQFKQLIFSETRGLSSLQCWKTCNAVNSKHNNRKRKYVKLQLFALLILRNCWFCSFKFFMFFCELYNMV